MTLRSLAERLTRAPRPMSIKVARARLEDLTTTTEGIAAGLPDLVQNAATRDLLLGVADHSPFIWRLACRDPRRLAAILREAPETALDACLKALADDGEDGSNEAALMRRLRIARQHVALLIALADIGGVWSVDDVIVAISDFADAAVSAALRFLLREAAREGKLRIADPRDPEQNCGLVVLAMGKHGARELNYSSDVDLIVFFDPMSPALPEGVEPSTIFVRITRALARLLQERTADDYVLRVDLRLRPDPGSTAVAISLPAAFSYYETLGQNWERAALIKARPVAGDLPLGKTFLADLAPFVWRKYFDYAAIADIHAMKRQIHAVRGHAEVAVAGHNVKLGRGGIREVEFFVQTQQLIFGGRRPALRGARTLDMLRELHDDGWVTRDAVDDLSAAYRYLRTIEHRLQMIADEQTQRLPDDDAGLIRFARFLGHARRSSFEKELTGHLRRVERHYARLFENAPGLDTRAGSLVFTGVTDDPETIETLRAMGFSDPPRAMETVRGWHFGGRPAIQGARAREVLTELVPSLLEAFATGGDPDAALIAFDEALGRMNGAVELFSILRSNADVRELFADILSGAPRLASVVGRMPHVLDAAIDPALARAPINADAYASRLATMARDARDTEAFLDGARDIAREEMFLIGVRALSGAMDAKPAGHAFSALAEAVLRTTLARVEADFASEYGRVARGRCAIIGMGRLGSREMTATSDLDLILIYEYDDAVVDSDGPRRLHPSTYYARLTQRLITALTAPTRRGKLYEVDLRLRPSGGKGPVATRLSAFRDYQVREAETWEHMALTRARVVAGDAALARDIESAVADILRARRDVEVTKREALAMRKLIAREKGDRDPWDLKLVAGGLMDIEFIAQYICLRHAEAHPTILDVAPLTIIKSAATLNLLPLDQAETLRTAHELFTTVTQLTRIAIDGAFHPATVAPGVLRRMASATGLPDFRTLEASLLAARRGVRGIFENVFR